MGRENLGIICDDSAQRKKVHIYIECLEHSQSNFQRVRCVGTLFQNHGRKGFIEHEYKGAIIGAVISIMAEITRRSTIIESSYCSASSTTCYYQGPGSP